MVQAERLCRWWHNDALPFWLERAFDRQHGGFYESLTLDGYPVTGDERRVRTQARQIYVFARAHVEGWADTVEVAQSSMERLREVANAPDGRPGWVHILDETGQVTSPVRDLYDHAFILLAHAWLYRASNDRCYIDQANEILAFLDSEMSAPVAGFRESIGSATRPRRQNPHMHLFEALLALYEVTHDPSHRDRLDALKTLFTRTFYRPEAGVLFEYFADDWGALTDDQWGVVEPGHLMEWVWLLSEYERLTGQGSPQTLDELWWSGLNLGRDSQSESLLTSIGPDGRVRQAGSRCWMQTEWVRAAAVRVQREQKFAQGDFDRSVLSLFNNHLAPAVPGGWIDAINGDGEGVSTKMPASTLYHVAGAVVEAERVSRSPEKTVE